MTENIDEGDIVGVERFAMPESADRMALDKMALENVTRLFNQSLPQLIDFDRAIVPTGYHWVGQPKSSEDFRALCKLPSDVSADKFERRYRVAGEGPNHALTITLFGQYFKLDNSRVQDEVVRGGVAAG